MKVLMINGSPRTKGNTFIALEEMKKSIRSRRCRSGNCTGGK